ncbi:MAG: BatA and WFA domain-containing protein [Planctomycetales bacterium]|nr:BatA and WFA domain-containing protein [Planctomycetales bacterium]
MSFLNPFAMMIGGAALAMPLVVHFLTRPRPKRLPLSTIEFVFESIRQRRSRHRIRDFLVLLLRVLAIALIAMAIARPNLNTNVVITPGESDVKVARVLIIDISQSMSAGRGGNQPIERARSVADRYLSAGEDLVADVIFAAARPAPVFEQLSSNLPALRQSVRSVDVNAQSADAMGTINLAAELLSRTDESMKRELVVISDFQRSDWGAVRFDALPSDTKIQLESVALESPDNLAVLAIRAPDRVIAGEEFRCEAELANYGVIDRPVRCQLKCGVLTKTVEKTLPPGESSVTFSMQFDQAGWQSGTVQLIDANDDLPADDLRPLALRISPAPRIVLLSGQNPDVKPSSGYYLSQAINKLRGTESDSSAIRVSAQKFDASATGNADVIIIDHPGRLDKKTLGQLGAMMRRGTGMIYVVSELADGVNLQGLQSEMGSSLQLPVRFVPPARGRARRDLSVLEISRREPPFEVFGDALDLALAPIRVGGGLGTELTEESLQDRILARLSDQTALLTMSDCGAGRLAILNLDLEQSNLPVLTAFLPLVGELTTAVLPASGSISETICGRPLVKLLPEDLSIEDDVIAGPTNDWAEIAEGYGNWEASGSGMIWNWPHPDSRGVYQATLNSRVIFQVAVSTPSAESDLKSLDAKVLDVEGKSDQRIGFRNVRDGNEDKDRLWNWLLVACLIGLVLEVCTLRVFQT